MRLFRLPALAVWPAALAYGLSPYAVAYLGRLSGVLLPAIGLPWLLGLTISSIRVRSWRHPALFALVVATVGSVNLTALALAVVAGLRIQGAYGMPVLQLTENLRTVAERSSPDDVLRGLGNWFFYGGDKHQRQHHQHSAAQAIVFTQIA